MRGRKFDPAEFRLPAVETAKFQPQMAFSVVGPGQTDLAEYLFRREEDAVRFIGESLTQYVVPVTITPTKDD